MRTLRIRAVITPIKASRFRS